MGRAFEYRKQRKFKRWGQMARTFTRVAKQIAIAVKEGGPDPDTNSRLRAILQNAREANVPKENIERAIKKASSKDQEDYKEIVYEGYGPYGIAVIVECATDNQTRTVANVRSYFNKCSGSLGTSGSVSFMFEHKCVFKVRSKAEIELEDMELELIDLGLDELFADEDQVHIYGEFEAFGKIQKYLEDNKFDIVSAEFERIPSETKELTPEQEADIEKLLNKFYEDEDIQNVWHNMR